MGEYLNLRVILRVVSSEIESMPWVPHRIERVFQEVLCVNRFKQGLVPANVFAAVIIVVVVVVVIVISRPRV